MPSDTLVAQKRKTERIASVEFWRFVFTTMVCLYHMEIYFTKGKVFPSGTMAVEFFFVLGGFLMTMSADHYLRKHPERPSVKEASYLATQFVWKKIKVMFPVVLITLILQLILAGPGSYKTILDAALHMEWELLFLVGTPFGYANGATPVVPLWFLTAMFISGYIYSYLLYRHNDLMKYLAPLLGVLFFAYFTLNSTLVLDFYVKMGFLSAGTVKGLAEMALGISCYRLYDYLSGKKLNRVWNIVLTLLMIFAVWRAFALTLFQPVGLDNFRRIIYAFLIVLLSFLNRDELTRLLNNRFSRWLGSISMTMYISHFTLCNLYFRLVFFMKMRHPMATFWRDMGGSSGWTTTAMNWKDRVVYMLLVVACAVVIRGVVAFISAIIRSKLEDRAAEAAG